MKVSKLKEIITEELGEKMCWYFTNTKAYTFNFESDRMRMRNQILYELSLNPYIIQNVIEPDEDMQMIVLRQNLDYIKLIKNPTERVVRYYIKKRILENKEIINFNNTMNKYASNNMITDEEKKAHIINNTTKELEKLLINKNIEND